MGVHVNIGSVCLLHDGTRMARVVKIVRDYGRELYPGAERQWGTEPFPDGRGFPIKRVVESALTVLTEMEALAWSAKSCSE